MSLPKEPRQKMINIMYLVLTALLAINISAEILNAFKTITASLEKTNGTVNASTTQIINSLAEKMTDESTKEKATIWHPKAKQVIDYSATAFTFIENLKKQLITEAGGNPADPESKFNEEDQNMVTRVMIKQGKGKELYKVLEDYIKNVLKDTAIGREFAKSLPISLEMPKKMNDKKKNWEEANFYMAPTVGALSILTKFQNDIKNSENKIVTFCHEQVGKVVYRQDAFAAIAVANATYVMPGQEIEVTAGVGGFSKAVAPQISVNGQGVPLGEDGAAKYTFKASEGSGTRSIVVNISYTDADGKKVSIPKTIEYTVGTPGGASVGLDKMNVFYIGVDNPITVASSTGWDKTKVSISGGGGQLVPAGGAGKFNVRVGSVTDACTITVNADNKISTFNYRVRTVPMAQAYVGGAPSGENIPASTFKAQGGVGAGMKDFPFELKYTVASFLISTDSDDGDIVEKAVQGNTFSGAQNVLNQVKAGKTVYIDNIRVIGPDGQNKKVPSLVYYIK